MNKKWLIAMICILLVVIIGVGGKVYMDKKAEQKEAEKIEAERMSVEALKERYANIKTVEFEKSVYDEVTGAHIMFIKMTDQNNQSANFSYTYWSGEKRVGSIRLENKEVQHKGHTEDKVKVIYTNGKEGEV